MDRKALSAAFPVTVPVLMGYLAIGIAFGLMLQEIGYNFIWAFFMSLTIYAGSGQYLGVTLLGAAASLGTVAVMTLLINFRHLVYGLSMLEKFRGMGPRKLYMIFSLTDETYALLSSARAPVGVDPRNFYFAIALLDQSYWILGSVIGAVAGALGTTNRGDKYGAYRVTTHMDFPAVLVECGFLTNPEELSKLQSDSYKNAIATSIADAIQNTLTSML